MNTSQASAHPLSVVLRPFVRICLLRDGPRDLPRSPLLLAMALLAHGLSGTLVSATVMDPFSALGAALVGTGLLCALNWGLLAVLGLGQRGVQTLTALAGCDALLGLVALPLVLVAGGPRPGLADVLLLALVGWSILVAGHILRRALSVHLMVGLVVALVLYFISIRVLHGLFPLV